MRYWFSILALLFCTSPALVVAQSTIQPQRARELGIDVGVLPAGRWNAITDVDGVRVGHQTLVEGESVRTGVTVIVPNTGNLFQQKVPAAIFCGNAFGKLAGSTQVQELGTLETPIALTNTLSVPVCVQALVRYTLDQSGNENARSVNAVVGETNDGFLNHIRGMHVRQTDVLAALRAAAGGAVTEGCVGAGTGTICFGWKGGIGTASRVLPPRRGGHTVGVLVQSNFGGILAVNGAPVGRELQQLADDDQDGSCMIVVATDAPLSPRNLQRLARRALFGMARTGATMSNGSGDYVIAFSTAYRLQAGATRHSVELLANNQMTGLFLAVAEASEEAIYNSLFAATSMQGRAGHRVAALPVEPTIEILKKYNLLNLHQRLPPRNR